MSTENSTPAADERWFRTAQGLLVPPFDGVTAIGPSTATGCTLCNDTVRARPVFASATSVRYVLPVDEQGRCASCSWMNP